MKTSVNNNEIGVWLPNKLFKNLKEQLIEYNQLGIKPKLNLAKAAYLLNLLYYIPLNAKDKYEDGWIPICSTSIKALKNYTKYLCFFKESGFIIENDKDYSTSTAKCKTFKLGGRYGSQLIKFHLISDNSHFVKKLNEFKLDRMKTADDKCNHLTKWLNPDLLTIDYKNAIKYTVDNYKGKGNIRKKNKRLFVIESIHKKSWSYSREGNDDRLHSILTSLPKDLRCYVKYNTEALISYDIKNSQPFIYASILNQLINTNKINLIKCFINNKYNKLYTSIMCDLFISTLNIADIKVFIDEVLEGTFYESYGDILYNESKISEDVNNECYIINVIKTSNELKRELSKFDGRRSVAKHIMLKTLFSSKNYHSDIINIFKKHYSEVFEVTQFIKKGRAKNFFPILLQNIEADCVLDYCTEKIAKDNPEMPLFTIHDSIITTSKYEVILERKFKRYLKLYFGLEPKLEAESWGVELFKAS